MAIKFLSGQTITGSITVSANVQAATFNSLAINTTGVNNIANQIVRTESNGYANFGWINSVSGNHTGSITRITASNDAYLRYVTPAQFRTGVTDGFYAPSSTVSGVTSVATGNGLTGGTIISTGTLTMSGSYTGAFAVAGTVSAIGSDKFLEVGSANTGTNFGFIGWNAASKYLFIGNSYNSAYNKDLVINSSGNVGIGTTSPTAARLVVQSGGTDPQILVKNTNASSDAKILLVDNDGGTQNASITFDQGGENQLYIATGYNSPSDLNRIYFQPGGEIAMTIRGGSNATGNAGNVGIGTTSPSSKLHLRDPGTNSDVGIKIGNDSRDWNLKVMGSVSDSLQFFTNDRSNVMTILSSGNVGIGTESPDNKLTVKAANCIIDAQSTADSQTIGFRAGYLNHGTLAGFFRYTTGDAQLYIDNDFVGNNGLYSDINFRNKTTGGTLTTRMKIKGSTGNVGIGTDDPSFQLSIENHATTTSTATLEIDGKRTNGADGPVGELIFSNNGDTFATVAGVRDTADNKGSLQFQTQDSTFATRMTISSEGNVGIGTSNPETTRLNVRGSTNDSSSQIFQAANLGGATKYAIRADGDNKWYKGDNSPSMVLTSTGRAGIGVTAPNAQLDVAGASVNQVGIALFTESSTTAYLTTSFNSRPTHTLYGINTTNTYVGTRLSHAGNTEFFHGTVKGASNGEMKYVFQGYNGTAYQEFGYIDCYTTGAGSLVMSGDVVAYSDKKLKKNIKTLDGSKVYKMRGVSFDRIDTGKKSSGVIAQEMQEVAPELVNESGETLGVAYGNISGYLIEAIKEQQKQIEDLQAQIKNITNSN